MIGLHSQSMVFKEVFTNKTLNINVNPFVTVGQFLTNVIPIISRRFEMNEDEIEIVEAGQSMQAHTDEFAPALVSSTRKLTDLWGRNLKYVSFYVRNKNTQYPQIERIRKIMTLTSEIVQYTGECPICLDSSQLSRRYDCLHGICTTCFSMCRTASISTCSLCRASEII